MVKDNTAVAQVQQSSSSSTSTPSSAMDPPNDVSQLLLKILRNVDKEVRTNLDLNEEAKVAVAKFRLISADLAVSPVAVVCHTHQGAQQSRSKS